jgi:subtilase family serine protease
VGAIGGTSAAAPQWSAIDAIANQADGELGFLTPRLYQIYGREQPGAGPGLHHVGNGAVSRVPLA